MMMKIFLKQVFVFVLILVGLNFVLFFLISSFYIKDYDEVDLSFSGYLLADSHGTPLGDYTENHDVHNFSGQSDSYLDMERKLKYLIRNTTVKKIYISVDDHTLSTKRDDQNNLDRSAYYADGDDFSNLKEFIQEKYIRYYIVFLNNRYSLIIRNFIQNELFNFSKWGSAGPRDSWEKLTVAEQKEISQNRINSYFEFAAPSAKMSKSLQRIISLCKANNIELVGLRFPLTKTYVDLLNNESYGADSVFRVNDLPIVDFDSLYLEQDSLFRDMDHLDRDGGKKFAAVLFADD